MFVTNGGGVLALAGPRALAWVLHPLPNPAREHVELPGLGADAQLVLLDAQGRCGRNI